MPSATAAVRGVLEHRTPRPGARRLALVTGPQAPPDFTVTVRELMAGAGVSVRGLAQTVHYDQGGLSKIIAGKRPCPAYLAKAVDEALGAGGTVVAAAAAARRDRERAVPRLTLAEQLAVLADEIRQLRAEVAALHAPPARPGAGVPAGAARTGDGTLRERRRSRGWDVPEMARQLRRAARETSQTVAAHDGLVRMIYAWERGDHEPSERYELLYAAVLGVSLDALRRGP